jgi:hypothetical protein
MSSSDIAISPVDAQKLLKNAKVTDPGVIIPERLEQIMHEIKRYITFEAQQNGFTRKARCVNGSPEYIWAHTTAPGIIWLWAQQDEDIRASWLSDPKESWADFDFKEPSPDSPIRWPSTSPSASASRSNPFSDYTPGTGDVSLPRPAARPAALPSGFGLSPPTTSSPVSFGSSSALASDSGPVSVPNSPTYQKPSSPNSPFGGYRKRKTRKTRRKSSRRGRSRSRHIRRKKTHHRRHRR